MLCVLLTASIHAQKLHVTHKNEVIQPSNQFHSFTYI